MTRAARVRIVAVLAAGTVVGCRRDHSDDNRLTTQYDAVAQPQLPATPDAAAPATPAAAPSASETTAVVVGKPCTSVMLAASQCQPRQLHDLGEVTALAIDGPTVAAAHRSTVTTTDLNTGKKSGSADFAGSIIAVDLWKGSLVVATSDGTVFMRDSSGNQTTVWSKKSPTDPILIEGLSAAPFGLVWITNEMTGKPSPKTLWAADWSGAPRIVRGAFGRTATASAFDNEIVVWDDGQLLSFAPKSASSSGTTSLTIAGVPPQKSAPPLLSCSTSWCALGSFPCAAKVGVPCPSDGGLFVWERSAPKGAAARRASDAQPVWVTVQADSPMVYWLDSKSLRATDVGPSGTTHTIVADVDRAVLRDHVLVYKRQGKLWVMQVP